MPHVGILGVGAAGPALRLSAASIDEAWDRRPGRGQIGVCAADEDSLTLAWQAADSALRAAGLDAGDVDTMWWGTSTPPFADGPSFTVLANAMRLRADIGGGLTTGSAHSGLDAFTAAADAIGAGSARVALLVASDALRAGVGTTFETRAGAGAVAMVLGATGGTATIARRVTRSRPSLDRYRGEGELDERDLYDGRLFREMIFVPLLEAVVGEFADFGATAWSLPDPDGRLAAAVARRAGVTHDASAATYAELGDTGAAAALLGLARALDARGRAVAVGYGGGRATAIGVEVVAAVPGAASVAADVADGAPCSYHRALRARGQLVAGGETIPMGVPPESALFARGAVEMLQFLGARCTDCGTVNTPPSIHPHCVACGGPKLEPVPLAGSGTVHTFVVNHTMPAPFEAPLPIAVIDLDDGARVMLQAVSGSEIEIGTRMRLVLRKYAHERGAPVYGFKARPVKEDA